MVWRSRIAVVVAMMTNRLKKKVGYGGDDDADADLVGQSWCRMASMAKVSRRCASHWSHCALAEVFEVEIDKE